MSRNGSTMSISVGSRAWAGRVVAALAAGGLLVAGGFLAPAAAAAPPSTWAQTDGNGAASRSNPDETVLTTSTVRHLSHRRGLTVPVAGDNYCDYSGIDLAASSGTVDYIQGNGRLAAYSASTGRRLWSVRPDPSNTTEYVSIAIAHGLVILGELDCISQSDPTGYMTAYNATTGAQVWAAGTDSALYSMVVSGSYVVETGSTVGSGVATSVHRVDNGALVWERESDPCFYTSGLAVIVARGEVISHRCDRDSNTVSLEARALTTGALTWYRPGDWSIQRADSSANAGRHLFLGIGDDNNILDVDPATGQTQNYLYAEGAIATAVLAVDRARVYAKCGAATVCAYAISGDAPLWSTADRSALAAVANGVLYLSDGRMLNAATGAALGRLFSTGSASTLIVAGGRVGAVTSPRTLDLYGRAGS